VKDCVRLRGTENILIDRRSGLKYAQELENTGFLINVTTVLSLEGLLEMSQGNSLRFKRTIPRPLSPADSQNAKHAA
jgi:hypothetical protein